MLDDDTPDYFLRQPEPESEPDATETPRQIHFAHTAEEPAAPAAPAPPHRRHARRILIWTAAIALAALSATAYFRYFTPYIEDAMAHVYITGVQKRGLIFKTYEATALTLPTVARPHTTPVDFSIESPSIADSLQKIQGTDTPLTIHYRTYYTTLPWRGESKNIITSITAHP